MTCGRNAVNHIYCGNFAFSLQKRAAYFRHSFCHIRSNFGLRGYWVAEIVAAARRYCSLGNCLVAFHKNLIGHNFHSPFYFNNTIGTHGSAEGAGDAIRLVRRLYGVVTLFVDLVGCKAQHLFGTYIHTKPAALAVVGFKCQFCHFIIFPCEKIF